MLRSQQLGLLKRRLLAKGSEINDALTRLLANETVDVDKLLGGGKPGETPAEKLRHFLGLIDERLRALREGRFGRCEVCGGEISFAELDQVPWQRECQHCAFVEAAGEHV